MRPIPDDAPTMSTREPRNDLSCGTRSNVAITPEPTVAGRTTVDGMDFDEHVRIFNAAVTSNDWSAFVATFDEDGIVEFVGPPVGPFIGRAAIAAAYAQNAPDDTIALAGPVREDGDETIVPYRWHTTGATGTMRATTPAGLITRLVITFD